jgi:hypothetical protein
VKLTEVIDFPHSSGDFFRDSLDDEFMVGTAVSGADHDFVHPAGQIENYGLPGAAAFVKTFPRRKETDAAVRTTGIRDAVQISFGGNETVQFVMTAPESVDEDPTLMAADSGVEADRRFAVQPHMVGHQAVAVPAVQLFDDEKILALFLYVLYSFRQSGKKFDGDLFVHKLHSFLLVDAELR